ncbi:MAG: MafI family immunity protein [Gallionellaceae bacterium]|nr:MafI family immunity protein [Gallionellaceae bacterium]
MHLYQRNIDLCNLALESVRAVIPDHLHSHVHDYINRFDEWGLGMEMLIDQISEFEIKISSEQFAFIERAMEAMGMGKSHRVMYLHKNSVIA